MNLRLALVACCLVSLLNGCSSPVESEPDTPTSVGSQSATVGASSSDVTEPTTGSAPGSVQPSAAVSASSEPGGSQPSGVPSGPVLPEGWQYAEIPYHQVRLGLPSQWIQFDPAVMAQAAPQDVPPLVQQMAELQGFSVSELLNAMSRELALTAFDPGSFDSETGVASTSLNIPKPGGETHLTDMKASLEALGAELSGDRAVQTPLGSGTAVSYTLYLDGVSSAGAVLALPDGESNVGINLNCVSLEACQTLVDGIASSWSMP